MNVCTIAARNYLPSARVLAKSLTRVHPDARVTVLVVDGDADPSDAELFQAIRLDDLIPDESERRRQTFMYDVTELSTAMKPLLLRHLLAGGAESALYFDPDIQIFDSIDGLNRLALDRGLVLTPHTFTPIPDDGFGASQLAVLRAGVFNAGFIGVGPGSDRFLDWWAARLHRHCLSDPSNGMFVDQRWLDGVTSWFPYAVSDDPGCNVAYWNLHERGVTRGPSGFLVNGRPLRFFHFSGFKADAPHLLSRHQGPKPRVLLSESPVLRELCDGYLAELRASGLCEATTRYGYGTLPDGTPVDVIMRRLYWRALIDAERSGKTPPPAPFTWDKILDWLNAPEPEAPRLSRYLFGLRQQRPDLQRAFPRPYGTEADAYLHWVVFDPDARRSIPASLRPMATPPHATNGFTAPAGLNVAGYFKAELGVGEIARLVVTAARAAAIPVHPVVNDRTHSRQQHGFELSPNGGPYATTLVCANADEFALAVDGLPAEIKAHGHRIGFWFWETEQLPSAYQPASDLLDEIWVATDYVAAAVRATVSKPVHVCPIPVHPPEVVEISRTELGLPEGFVFLFMFDFLSHIQRKNPIGLIKAFRAAFQPGEGPTLVLKSINGEHTRPSLEAVRAATGGREDIRMIDGYVTARERDALMNACDCYVSLHRSEGFGLTLADAMALGKPTIATAYSGNLAFMTDENSFLVPWQPGRVPAGCAPYPEGDAWAEPDLDAAASQMRLVYNSPTVARDRGRLGRAHILEHLSPERTVAFINTRLHAIDAAGAVADSATFPMNGTPAAGSGLHPVAPPAIESVPVPSDASAAAPAEPERLTALIEQAAHDALIAEQMLAGGIPSSTPSRFGWPGRLLRSAMLRLLRPYATFDASTQQQHLQSTQRMVESLRRLESEVSALREARDQSERRGQRERDQSR